MPEGVKEKYYEGKGYAGKAYDDARSKAKEYMPENREGRDTGYKGSKGYKDEGSSYKNYDKEDRNSKWYSGESKHGKHSHDESRQQDKKAKYGFVDESLRGGSGSQACK